MAPVSVLGGKAAVPQVSPTAPFRKRGWPAGPGDFSLSQKGVARRAGGFFSFAKGGGPQGRGIFPFRKRGWPRRAGGFLLLSCAHRKGKSSVSCADSSFCERSLFHARGDRAGGFFLLPGRRRKRPHRSDSGAGADLWGGSEQAGDPAVLVHVDLFGGRDLGQTGHGAPPDQAPAGTPQIGNPRAEWIRPPEILRGAPDLRRRSGGALTRPYDHALRTGR